MFPSRIVHVGADFRFGITTTVKIPLQIQSTDSETLALINDSSVSRHFDINEFSLANKNFSFRFPHSHLIDKRKENKRWRSVAALQPTPFSEMSLLDAPSAHSLKGAENLS